MLAAALRLTWSTPSLVLLSCLLLLPLPSSGQLLLAWPIPLILVPLSCRALSLAALQPWLFPRDPPMGQVPLARGARPTVPTSARVPMQGDPKMAQRSSPLARVVLGARPQALVPPLHPLQLGGL